MQIKELRQLTEKELLDLLQDKRGKLGQLKFSVAMKKVKNVHELRNLRHDVARILTLLNNKN